MQKKGNGNETTAAHIRFSLELLFSYTAISQTEKVHKFLSLTHAHTHTHTEATMHMRDAVFSLHDNNKEAAGQEPGVWRWVMLQIGSANTILY